MTWRSLRTYRGTLEKFTFEGLKTANGGSRGEFG
jgi:hypothetical protein